MLSLLNQHSRDLGITFDEEAHKYTLVADAALKLTSVTTVIKQFFNEFDADKVLAKMARFGALDKKYPNMTQAEVKQAWKDKGQQAAATGTRLHKYIELFFNGVEGKEDETIGTEVGMFKDWICELEPRYVPYRTEWVLWDAELQIAGTIDMLFQVSNVNPRRVAIFDWKCSKAINYKNRYERAKEPIAHLDDCNYQHYCLQLNLYKYLLEKNYDLDVVEMNLVVIHRTNESAQIIPVPIRTEDIQAMLRAKNAVELSE